MNSSSLMLALSQFAHQIPVLAVCIIGIVLLLPRRPEAPQAIGWATAGFGVAAALSFLLPFAYAALSALQMQSGSYGSLAWAYTVLGFVSALVHAGSYLLLLLACLRFLRPTAA